MPLTLFNYIATFLVGGTVALMLWALLRTLMRKPPGWIYPAVIGATMIGFQIYADYSWFSRTAAGLPPTMVVTDTYAGTSPLKVWSYAIPIVDRFRVVDTASVKRNPAVPDLVIADVHLVTRFRQTVTTRQVFDCVGHRRADGYAGVTFDAEGRPQGLTWEDLSADDAMLRAACEAPDPPAPASG